ncbi:MAG: signal peptidase II [Candidatus Sumerlaeota bacterium]|nr:signal peptidase II [Candidatus Sumerlaeota bacterium]
MNYWIIASVFLLDQLTKYMAVRFLSNQVNSIVLVPGFLGLILRQNRGAAYSMLEDQTMLLTLVTLTAVILIGWMALRTPREQLWARCGYSLILGGALGNLYDRILRGALFQGHVVDFMEFKFPGFFERFGFVNNLADDAICIGMGCVLVALFLYAHPKEIMDEPKTEN